MSKTVPTKCRVDGCIFADRITSADIVQVRKHLVLSHDYFDLQKTAVRLGLIKSENEYRGYSWLLRKVSEASILKEVNFIE